MHKSKLAIAICIALHLYLVPHAGVFVQYITIFCKQILLFFVNKYYYFVEAYS